jgi:hypothetical protein
LFEGLAVGPQLNDGSYMLLLGNDNDFSVTQTGSASKKMSAPEALR